MPVEQTFAYGTVATYAILALLWGAILVLYLRNRRVARREDPLIALLLAVLALDAFKSLIESVYFGVVWTANYGLGFAALREPLSHPVPLTLTKVLNLFVAATVLTVLLRRWLPAELAQRRAQREERERLLRQQLESQKLESLGLLAGGIAHDFNNLLWTVSGNAEIVAKALPDDSRLQTRVTAIRAAARRGVALTRQLLVYAGQQETAPEPLDLGALVADIAELLRVSIPQGTVLSIELEPELPEVQGEAAQLQQVALNLLTNAADAVGPRGGRITVSVRRERLDRDALAAFRGENLTAGDYVLLEVADTGCGMDEATRARIFDPFFSTKGTGRGLGLAALVGILRAHAGGVAIESAPGRGTRFRIALPALAPQPRAAQAPPRLLPRGAGVALVVGSDGPGRQQLAEQLGQVGFEVATAATVAEAQTAAENAGAALSLAIVERELPDGSGADLSRQLHQANPSLPQLILAASDSAASDPADRSDLPAHALPLGHPPGNPPAPDDLHSALVRLGFTG